MKKLIIASEDNLHTELSLILPALKEADILIIGCDDNEIMLPEGISSAYCTAKTAPECLSNAAAASAEELFRKNNYDIAVFSASLSAAALMTAAELGLEIFPDITYLNIERERSVLRRRVYGSNIEAEIELCGKAVLSFAAQKAAKLPMKKKLSCNKLEASKPDWIIKSVSTGKKEESRLKKAKIVFAAGKGIGSRENYLRLKALAEKFGAACGASRAVVLSGWADTDEMIGQSGTICSPELCICFGVSGAAPFLIGVEQAGKLIAVNTDPSASIFKAADYGIISDCVEIMNLMSDL